MKLTRILVRLAGWLLTPLVAWAASFVGAWLGALVFSGARSTTTTLIATGAFGAVFAITAAWAWLRFLRRSPRLQHSLEVAPDGTPLAAIVDEPPPGGPAT